MLERIKTNYKEHILLIATLALILSVDFTKLLELFVNGTALYILLFIMVNIILKLRPKKEKEEKSE